MGTRHAHVFTCHLDSFQATAAGSVVGTETGCPQSLKYLPFGPLPTVCQPLLSGSICSSLTQTGLNNEEACSPTKQEVQKEASPSVGSLSQQCTSLAA